MKKLINLLGLTPPEGQAEVSEDQIVAAVVALKKAAAGADTATARETKIQALMLKTGMQRTDAEHVIDQQAKEDKARTAAQKTTKK